MSEPADIKKMCDRVREIAYAIHVYHGNGYLEKVYENALAHRLRKVGFDVAQQQPMTITDDDGTILGEHSADIVVNGTLLIELKACKTLTHEHKAQLLHYLKATSIRHGMLIDFGSFRFEALKYIQGQPVAEDI